jgi:hypothetical protein
LFPCVLVVSYKKKFRCCLLSRGILLVLQARIMNWNFAFKPWSNKHNSEMVWILPPGFLCIFLSLAFLGFIGTKQK